MSVPDTRRSFLKKVFVLPLAAFVASCTGRTTNPTPTGAPSSARTLVPPSATAPVVLAQPTSAPVASPAATLAPTPACGDDDDEPTVAQTEGPYFTPDSPERSSFLEEGISGARLVVSGFVLSTACQPVPGALVDFWHCDDSGVYDNEGYRLRGHQFTGESGRYSLETIVPGLYPGRTRHIHVKVQAPNRPVLTTQLYFPGEPENARDGIFHEALLMTVSDDGDARAGAFDFVVEI